MLDLVSNAIAVLFLVVLVGGVLLYGIAWVLSKYVDFH